MVDWDTELTVSYSQPLLEEEIDTLFVQEFMESLTTIGLVKHTDGTSKKAWSEFTHWLKAFN
jgi:hypothetical protein